MNAGLFPILMLRCKCERSISEPDRHPQGAHPMSAAAFDTRSAARDLEAAGIERAHGEAIARTIGRSDERSATLSWPIS